MCVSPPPGPGHASDPFSLRGAGGGGPLMTRAPSPQVRTVEQDSLLNRIKGTQKAHDDKMARAARRRAAVAATTTPVGVVRRSAVGAYARPASATASRRNVPGFMPPGFAAPRDPIPDRPRSASVPGRQTSIRTMFAHQSAREREEAALDADRARAWRRSEEWARHDTGCVPRRLVTSPGHTP